jgi:hypothetical protein
MPTFLSPARDTLLAADRVFGGTSPEARAVGELLVSFDPESRLLANRYERRMRWLLRHAESPRQQFERLHAAADKRA